MWLAADRGIRVEISVLLATEAALFLLRHRTSRQRRLESVFRETKFAETNSKLVAIELREGGGNLSCAS